MKTHRGLLLRVLLNRAHNTITPPLLQMLPKEEAESVSRYEVTATDPRPIFQLNRDALSKMHYSWIHSFLQSVEPKQRRTFLSCLEEAQMKGAARLFGENPPAPVHSPSLRRFYLDRLMSQLPLEEHFPLEYIPANPFKRLLSLSKSQLVEIIDLLSMYDLSHEIRRIVATENLKRLYACLTAKQQQFLRICLNQKDKVTTSSLHLEKWNGNCQTLLRMLQQRGITRLAIALAGQHPDLIWYIAHTLDTGRGALLQKQVREEEVPRLTPAMVLQLENILTHLAQLERGDT